MANRIRVSGTVAGVSPAMATIKPDPGSANPAPLIMIDADTQFGGLSLETFLSVGLKVTGEFDVNAGRLIPDLDTWTESRFLTEYPDGTVVLGRVATVSRQSASVRLHPTLAVEMKRDDVSANPKDVVDHLWSVGDIVAVRVVRDPRGLLRLRSTDIDDDEPVATAPSVFADGEPWLTVAQMMLIEATKQTWERERADAEAFSTALDVLANRMSLDIAELESMLGSLGTDTGEVPVVTSTDELSPRDKSLSEFSAKHIQRMILNYQVELQKLVEKNQGLSELLSAKARRESDLAEQAEKLRAQLSVVRQELQEANKASHSGATTFSIADRRARFATVTEWIEEEIRRFWIDTYAPADRVTFPIDRQPWSILPSFAETFELLTEDGMEKAIKTATHIVTGRNAIEHITEDHPLREGDESSRPEVVRDDGAASRRAYIESHTSQARRLHYWRLRNGSIELSRVGLHDDFTP